MKKRIVSKPTKKLLSMLLASVMLLVSIPMTVVGEGLSIGQIGADDNAQLIGTTDTFYEDVSMRDEFSKHYVLESGERYAVIFPEAVHYEEDGEWKEVDNRLTYNSLTGKYVSTNPKFTTAFAANASAAELVSISHGEYTISWGISFAENSGELMKLTAGASVTNGNDTADRLSAAKAEQASLARVAAETNQAFDAEEAENVYKNTVTDIGKAASAISYGGSANSAVSLRYSVAHGKVEEDIILRSKSDFTSYTMTVNTGGLTVTAETDGSVIFKTADGETVFTIDAPWMKDSAYGFSKDIAVTVTQTGNTATVTYTPSAEWLNSEDRVYPVLIDPTITSKEHHASIIDTYALDGDWNFNYYDGNQSLLAGMSPVGEWFTFIKMQTFPSSVISSDYTVTSGELILYTSEYYDNLLTLHKATSAWVGEEVNTPPSTEECDSNVSISSDLIYGIYKYVFDLTGYFGEINNNYDGDYAYYWSNYNHGFMISSTYSGTDDVTTMYSSNTQSINYRPMVTYTYEPKPVAEDKIGDWFIEGGIYEIKSIGSQKYVGLQYGSNSDGSNVYQANYSSAGHQSFNFVYCGNGKYKIKPVLASNKVVGFDYAAALVNEYANVQLYDEFISHMENEENNIFWSIEFTSNSEVRIVSYADPSLIFCVVDDQDGCSSGTSQSSAGNIIVKRQDGSILPYYETWRIMSRGNIIWKVDDITKSTETTLNVGDNLRLNTAATSLSTSITWSSSDNCVATVSTNGYITAVGIGTVTISASEAPPGGDPGVKSITITVVFPGSNEICIKDVAGENALSFDSEDTYSVGMADWDASENQVWIYSGYYTIRFPGWGYLSAPESDSSGAGVLISSTSYPGPSDTQLWKISSLGDGTYKIQSKYHENEGSDLVLAQGDYGTVALQNYTDDSNYSDGWKVFELYDSTLIATYDPKFGNTHLDSHASVLASLNTMGYTKNRVFEYTNASSCIEYMSTSKIVFTIGHGDKYKIILSDGELTINDLNLLPDNAFAVCQLVLYGACNTALGGEEDSSNLVNKTHAKGAVTVVGFEDQVETKAMNIWAEAFFEALALGENVQEACQEAKDAVLFEYSVEEEEEEEEKDEYRGTDSYIIAGSKTQTFN